MLIFPSCEKIWVQMELVQLQLPGAFIYKAEKFLALRTICRWLSTYLAHFCSISLHDLTLEASKYKGCVVFFPSRPWKISQASFLNSLLYLYLIVKWKYQGTGYSILVPQYFGMTLTAKLLKLPLGFPSSYYPEKFCICNPTICAYITFHVAALKTCFVVPWGLN